MPWEAAVTVFTCLPGEGKGLADSMIEARGFEVGAEGKTVDDSGATLKEVLE